MKLITGAYVHCQQHLCDDWLIGGEPEIDAEAAQVRH